MKNKNAVHQDLEDLKTDTDIFESQNAAEQDAPEKDPFEKLEDDIYQKEEQKTIKDTPFETTTTSVPKIGLSDPYDPR